MREKKERKEKKKFPVGSRYYYVINQNNQNKQKKRKNIEKANKHTNFSLSFVKIKLKLIDCCV